ncbi:MAG TPA: arginine--tRNA ligase [Pyrinomonadaceae bacterium]|nr:arginine--tRNA ligase [Pyrinomonadaceae bacterium]
MTLTEINEVLRERIRSTAKAAFDIELDHVASETPPKTELGDFAFPIAFELAKKIKQETDEKRNPREIAELLKASLEEFDFVQQVAVAGAGYLNVYLNRAEFLAQRVSSDPLPSRHRSTDTASPKVCVEHTSVNPNKAAHIGHVRNSVLGDTFHRILRASGNRVEVQNYIDNTGVQVADVVVGFIYLENKTLDDIKSLDQSLKADGKSFDYYCWDLYTRVGQEYQSNEELKQKRPEVLHLVEEGGNETAALADYVATRNVECILDTMARLSIRYDLLPRESEILHLNFWDKAFEQMKQLGVIHFESDGKNAGCWVMPFESHAGTDEHEADKILVRSNGTVTYTGKDIAYQMWKLGLLGMDFYYKKFYEYEDGREVWVTTAEESENQSHRRGFGHGETVYNVIDSRQSYTQDVVKKGVAAISPEKGERASIHLAYEMVALSPAAAGELGFKLSEEDRSRSFIEMSGRKGLGVKADDLIDRLEADALAEVESRHPDIGADEKRSIAHQIAIGALRYFLLKFTKNTVIIFDFKEALSFEGETGCFCQYSAVRTNSIFRKLAESGESLETSIETVRGAAHTSAVFEGDAGNDIWSMLILASRLEETVLQAASASEPAILAKYTFNLAKQFNLFYHNHKILPEKDPAKRAVLLTVADSVRRSLTEALATMGIEVPPRM